MREIETTFVNMMASSTAFDDEQKKYLVNIIDSVINAFGINRDEIGDALMANATSRENMSKIIPCWLQVLNFEDKNNMYDGRNNYSVKVGISIPYESVLPSEIAQYGFSSNEELEYCANHFTSKMMMRDHPLNVGKYVSLYMMRNHRTLQQTFSSIIFYILSKYYKVEMKDSHWYDCPCI